MSIALRTAVFSALFALLLFVLLPPSTSATVGGCALFPPTNVWNTRIDALPVHPSSATWISSIGSGTGLHPDFGSGTWNGGPIGIPYTTVPGTQPLVPVSFYYPGESDPGPYPIPPDAPVEYGSDHHVLVVDRDHCRLYEMCDASLNPDGGWSAGSGAVFDLGSQAHRPAGWTSADAARLADFARSRPL